MQQDEHFIRRIRRRMLDKVRVHLAYQPLHKLKRFLREFVWTFDDAERPPPPTLETGRLHLFIPVMQGFPQTLHQLTLDYGNGVMLPIDRIKLVR